MKIEDIVERFQILASKSTLSKTEHNEARQLMRLLKEAGMSNEEISKLSNRKWTPSTVKFYTPGIKPAQPSPWQDSIGLLNALISGGMTLDDVELAVTVHQNLEEQGLELKQIVELLITTDSASSNLGTLIQTNESLKESGLSIKDVQEILELRKEIERREFSVDTLMHLVELIKKYGEPEQISKAVLEHVSLMELREQNEVMNTKLENARQDLVRIQQEVEQTKNKLSQMREPLQAYEKIESLGFTEKVINRLYNLAQKSGGVRKLLQAVEAYADYSDIVDKVDKVKVTLAKLEVKVTKLEVQYAHLKTATSMCDTLINEYNFGLDVISTIFSVAKKYGEPISVLKGLEVYGRLKILEDELARVEEKLTTRKTLLLQLESRYHEMMDKIDLLNATTLKAGTNIGRLENQLAESQHLWKVINLINNPAEAPYSEYGPLTLVVAVSLKSWVVTNERKFPGAFSIKGGLQSLIHDLGGG